MLYSIKDIEKLSGIKAHTIRIWEHRYSFIKPRRTDTNIRLYSVDELKTILNVSMLTRHGYRISQIDKMSREDICKNVLSLSDELAKVNATVNRLLECMIDFDIDNFEKTLDDTIHTVGIERTIIHIVLPFLDKVGILWQSDRINPAQERLVSNIIRQKIILGIDQLPQKIKSKKKICLFLPESEYHELSLLFVAFLLKKRGVPTIYLGANIPFSELKSVVAALKPDFLYSHITTAGQGFDFENFLNVIHLNFPYTPAYISGRVTCCYEKKIPHNIFLKTSLAEVTEFINNL
jgi:MerR family transcriptional regulator, light-induced transcriptional regulator